MFGGNGLPELGSAMTPGYPVSDYFQVLVRGRETFIYRSERRSSHQLPLRMCRQRAGSCGNHAVGVTELAPTGSREGSQRVRVVPSQGGQPKPQAVA